MKHWLLIGIATCAWTTPRYNTNGTPAHIAAYLLSYGRCNAAKTDYPIVKDVIRTTRNTYIVRRLGKGAWCFSVIAVPVQGRPSDSSNVAHKVIT